MALHTEKNFDIHKEIFFLFVVRTRVQSQEINAQFSSGLYSMKSERKFYEKSILPLENLIFMHKSRGFTSQRNNLKLLCN